MEKKADLENKSEMMNVCKGRKQRKKNGSSCLQIGLIDRYDVSITASRHIKPSRIIYFIKVFFLRKESLLRTEVPQMSRILPAIKFRSKQ